METIRVTGGFLCGPCVPVGRHEYRHPLDFAFMNSGLITTTFNDAYIAELFEAYRRDPASVDDSWRQFFDVAQRFAESGAPAAAPGGGPADPVLLKKAAGAAALMQA